MIWFIRMLIKITMPVVFLGGGIAGAYFLIINPPSPERKALEEDSTLVEILQAEAGTHVVLLNHIGEVMPAREVTLQPQVSGRLVEIHPNLVPGGRFSAGDVIARIESRDYKYIIEQREADVETARMRLKEEQGRQATAEREWNLLGNEVETSEIGRELALRKPYLENAEATLAAAQSRLNEAKLSLERTVLVAPFHCFVMDEFVDVGQLVSPQSNIATLAGTDQFWINVKLPFDELAWLDIPGFNAEIGSRATVRRDTRIALRIEYEGRILKLLGNMNQTKMAQLLIGVDDPQRLGEENAGSLPLLLGDIVRVTLEGKRLDNVIAVPRLALRESTTGNDTVWVMDANNRLAIRDVQIVHRRENDVLVNAGIETGDAIVTSRIGVPVPGMLLRTAEPAPEREAPTLGGADTDARQEEIEVQP